MNKILIAGCTLLTAFAAVAMPNKKELAKAQRLVEDVTAADIKALKAGTKTPKEVAETHMQLAEKAENQAEKYLLYQGAFRIYARNEEYDRAADALQAISRDVDDVPPELIIEIVSKEMRRVAGKKAPRILTIFKQAKRTAKYRKEIVTVQASLKAKPADAELNRKYGECLAELGRWKEAIPAFAKSAGEVSKIAAGEKDGKLPPQQCADFWWDYGGETDDFTTYKVHAAQLYKKAMADTAFEGLARTRAEQRVKEIAATIDCSSCRAVDTQHGLYCVIDLSGGPNSARYPVSYLSVAPNGGWSDEYKTKKLVLRRISAGKDPCGRYELTKDFYIGVFEVTQQQYELMGGMNAAPWTAASFPAVKITYDGLRGPIKGALWPKSGDVDDASVIGKLRKKTGLHFDLPTEAQWEYACRAGTSSPFNNGGYSEEDMKKLGRYKGNASDDKGGNGHYTNVGQYRPNAWGLFDMHGNVWELCLDWNNQPNRSGIDPVGGETGKEPRRVCKSGSYNMPCKGVSSDYRESMSPNSSNEQDGFRLVIGPDLVSEWNEKHKTRK